MLHVGEEPQHAWGQPLALAVPAAEAAAGEEARPELARERRALLSGRTRRKKMPSAISSRPDLTGEATGRELWGWRSHLTCY